MNEAEMIVHCPHDRMVEISALKPHPKNRNEHPKEQIERLAQILRYQGFRYPIKVSNLSGFITSGHGRLEAAKLNGWTTVPVSFQAYKDEAQEYADLQADNAIAAWSELDLAAINQDILDLGPEFDIDLLGIEDFVLEPAEKFEPQADEDEVPEQVEPKTKLGDIYQLGRHRLMCGDSTSVDAIEKLMNGEKADLVFTDPPYNLGNEMNTGLYKNTYSLQDHEKLSQISWDKDFDIKPVILNLFTVLARDAAMYICTSHFLAGDIWSETKKIMDRIGWCVWNKPNPTPSLQKRHWTWSAELICYATRGDHVFNFPDKGHASNVWTFQKERHTENHPTQKPVAIPEHAITHSSNRGAIVLDLFGGSGSTLIAAEKTGRNCFMMELDPYYCDVIVARWEKYTGLKAELVSEGIAVPG